MKFEEFQEKIKELQKEWLIAGKYDPECILYEQKDAYIAKYQPDSPEKSVFDMTVSYSVKNKVWRFSDMLYVEKDDGSRELKENHSLKPIHSFQELKIALKEKEVNHVLTLIENKQIYVFEPEIWGQRDNDEEVHCLLEDKDFAGELVRASGGGNVILRYITSEDYLDDELGDDEWELPYVTAELFDYDEQNNQIEDVNKMEVLWGAWYGCINGDYIDLNEALNAFMSDCRDVMQEEMKYNREKMIKKSKDDLFYE